MAVFYPAYKELAGSIWKTWRHFMFKLFFWCCCSHPVFV